MHSILRLTEIPLSPLSRWDARWKLVGLLLAAAGALGLRRIETLSVALFMVGLLVVLSKVPRRLLLIWLVGLGLALLPFLIILPFTLDDGSHGRQVGPLQMSSYGLFVAVSVALRCLSVGGLALVLVATTPMHHTLAAAQRLGLPTVMIGVTQLCFRYAFLLADELRRLRIAMRMRGFRMKANLSSYRTIGHMTGALLTRSLDRADHVANAMACRGFDGRFRTLTPFRTSSRDILSFLICMSVTIMLVVCDRIRD